MIKIDREKIGRVLVERGGLAAWLLRRFRAGFVRHPQRRPRLALLERISLAPRQSLALVEAEGRRFLVATSMEGGAALYPLDGSRSKSPGAAQHRLGGSVRNSANAAARVSW